jgi:hypothetical protein
MAIVRNFKILSDKFNMYSIHSCEWNCSKKVKNSRNISGGYRCVGQLSLRSRKASFEFWLWLFSLFILCAVERGCPHLRMCRRYQGKCYWLHSLRFREFYRLWKFVCFLRFSDFTKPYITLWFVQWLYAMQFVVWKYYSIKRISVDCELDFAQTSFNFFVLDSSDLALNDGMKEFGNKPP